MMIAITVPVVEFAIPLDLVVLGVITGLTYSLIGVGLTLVFTSSRVLNLAAGEMGALPSLMVPILILNYGWPYWVTVPLALVTATLLGALIEFLVIRRLARAARLTMLVATIGLAQALLGLGLLVPRGGALTGKQYPTPFDASLTIGGVSLGPGQLSILIIVPLASLALTAFLRRSALGRASRASADNPEAASLAGIPTRRVSLVIWAIAGLLAGLAAVLVGPTRPLVFSEALGPSLLLRALGAAMIGSLTRIPLTFVGGIVIGLVETLVLFNYPSGDTLDLILAGIIVVSLLIKSDLGAGRRESRGSAWANLGSILPLPPPIARDVRVRFAKAGTLAAAGGLAVLAPLALSASSQFLLTTVVLFALMGLSLVVLTGYAGHVSLGQFAFVGVGAAVGGRLYQLGYPHVVAAVGVIVVGAAVAWVVGLPALRVRGLFLAVTTLAFALVVSTWMFAQEWLVTTTAAFGTSLQIPRPELLGLDFEDERAYYWLCLTILALVALLVYRLRRSQWGRAMVATRDNEAAAASLSWSPRRMKLAAFVIAGSIASLAGLLYGSLLTRFSSDPGAVFGPSESLALIVTTVFGGVTTITGAVLGAIWVQGIPQILGDGYALASSGFGLLLVLILLPNGLASLVFQLRDRVVRKLVPNASYGLGREVLEIEPGATMPIQEDSTQRNLVEHASRGGVDADNRVGAELSGSPVTYDPAPGKAVPGEIALNAREVTVRYGGLMALDGVSIDAGKGELLGLMGPNGAGKTTLLDVLSGNCAPTRGHVFLDGEEVTHLSPQRRARRGLGRSFQQGNLFGELTVLECVSLADQRQQRARFLSALIGTPGARREERRRRASATDIIDFLGIGEFAHRPVSELPQGIRRLVQLGCVSALGAHVLLLDEPTAGFTAREVESFSRIVDEVRSYLDATIVMIDHDVPMMRSLVDRLYVLEQGRVIAEGPPSVLDSNEQVAMAYLGQ